MRVSYPSSMRSVDPLLDNRHLDSTASTLFYFVGILLISPRILFRCGTLHALVNTGGILWWFYSDNVFITTPDSLLSERLVRCPLEIECTQFAFEYVARYTAIRVVRCAFVAMENNPTHLLYSSKPHIAPLVCPNNFIHANSSQLGN